MTIEDDLLEIQRTKTISRGAYKKALLHFDAAICEALAVGQKQAGRPHPYAGYATYVFAQLCAHGTSMVRAAPLSRWVTSESEDWNFSAVAGHARAILEGILLFAYLIEPPASEDEHRAKIAVMQLNDCTHRIDLHSDFGAEAEAEFFKEQQEQLRDRLRHNAYFMALDPVVRKSCLKGKKLMINSRDQLIDQIGIPREQFNGLFDLFSQHTHILTMSFYRMEDNGRNTGIENDADRSYIGMALLICSQIMVAATDKLQEVFPDVYSVRKGIDSIFSPGPTHNSPPPIALAARERQVQISQLYGRLNPLARSIASSVGHTDNKHDLPLQKMVSGTIKCSGGGPPVCADLALTPFLHLYWTAF